MRAVLGGSSRPEERALIRVPGALGCFAQTPLQVQPADHWNCAADDQFGRAGSGVVPACSF